MPRSSPLYVVFSVLAILVNLSCEARNVTVDNTNSLITYSPEPCFKSPPPNCSSEWQLTNSLGAFNGTTSSTNGTLVAEGLNILPRLTYTFQGTSILYVPGRDSDATATVVVDDLPSVLVDTAHDAFSGIGLDPTTFHTITVTYVPPTDGTTKVLSVDYFIVGQDDTNSSSTTTATSTVLTPAPVPAPTTSSRTPPSSPTVVPPSSSQPQNLTTSRPAPGTIAAISLSAALVLVLSGMVWLFTAQRRRRQQRAVMREAEILRGMRLPSTLGQEEARLGSIPGQRQSMGVTPAESGAQRQANNNMLRDNRTISPLHPVHYVPWRP